MPKEQHNQATNYIAIDISKATLEVRSADNCMSLANSPEGHKELIQHAKSLPHPLAVFEASGGYERELCAALHKARVPLVMVNPARVRAFAISEGVKAKTDPIDTRMILAFARSKSLNAVQPPAPKALKLAALLDRRDHLVEQLAREKNRLQNSERFIHRSIQKMIRFLEKEIAAIEKRVQQLIDSEPEFKSNFQTMLSIEGVGKVTAWTLLAYLSELQTLNRNKAVALAGLAPFNRDSGTVKGKRKIQGGRAKVRKCLYMAAHTAATCNPVISAYVQRLRDRGKPYKCAIVAAMRKLLIHIQSLIKKDQLSPC